jgi:hypothetical protein
MSFIKELCATQMGFITSEQLPRVIEENPDQVVLVRCNMQRFVCKAVEAAGRMSVIELNPNDWVRDVSIPAGDPSWK